MALLEGRDGKPIQVAQSGRSGWFEVRIDDLEGFLFATFILPPPEGFVIAQTVDRSQADLLTRTGQPFGTSNATFSKVLVTSTQGGSWEVLLPSGGVVFINPSRFEVISDGG